MIKPLFLGLLLYSQLTVFAQVKVSQVTKSDSVIINSANDDNNNLYRQSDLGFGLIEFIQVDFILNDFSDFKPILKKYNIDLMNQSSGILSFEIAGTYKRYYAGFNFGWANDGDYDNDSLYIELKTTQYGLHFGYNILNTKRLLLTPKAAFKWNKYRLLNNDKDNRIPIEQYVSERDLDLRFNQMTGFVGFNLSYKIYKSSLLPIDYWTFGIYGGYAFKLHDRPLIYSRGNRLTSSGKIEVENYNIGINLSFNID